MDLDVSKKAQLIVFLDLILKKDYCSKFFPAGTVAHMTVRGVTGTYMYRGRWYRIV